MAEVLFVHMGSGANMKTVHLLILSIAVGGCATNLSPQAEKMKLVSASEKEHCGRIKLVSYTQTLGPDKPGNALKGAMNEAAAAGANSFYIVSTSTHAFDGASVIGEALRCP